MAQITKKVREIVRDRIQSAQYGLNAQISGLISGSGVDDLPIIDWSEEARQFFQSSLSFDDVVESDSPATPCVFLYCTGCENLNRVKFRTFSGTVTMQVDVVIEAEPARGPEALENLADLIEESLITCLNSSGWTATQGTTGVGYNGQLSTQRTQVSLTNSKNWRQVISATATFEVTT